MRHHQTEVSYSVVTLCFVYGEREKVTIVQKTMQILGVLKCPLEVDLSMLTKASLQDKKLGTLPK